MRQRGNDLEGSHQGDFLSRDLRGTIDGASLRISSAYDESHGDAINYTFTGTVSGDEMAGDVEMGEYLAARFSARRHPAGRA